MRFTTRTHPSRPSCSSLRDTHVGSNTNNGTQCELAYLNANNAPGNRNRNIGGHGMLFKILVSPSLGHCDSKFDLDIQTTFIQDWLVSIGLECRISDPIPLDTNYLDFVGFRVNHHKTLLRKGLADNFKSSVRARNLPSIPSYYGWCKEAGALNLFHKHVGAFP